MNKYTARALNEQAALLGRVILVVSAGWREADDAFDELTATALPTQTRITRGHGHQRIEYQTGGRIIMASASGQGQRGVSADIVFVEHDAEYRNPHVLEDALPCIQASPHGEVIRA